MTTTRERLIDGAIELLSKGGEDALTLRALGEHCGLSRGAPYRHFEDKDALIRAVAAAGMRELTRKMRKAQSSKPGDALPPAMDAYIKWAMGNPAWYGVTFRNEASSPASGANDPELMEALSGLYGLVTQLITDGQGAGSIPCVDPKALVGVLWSTLHGAVDLAQSGHTKTEIAADHPRRVVADLLRLIAGSSKQRR
jgi:AcrR family transcriptional regulator